MYSGSVARAAVRRPGVDGGAARRAAPSPVVARQSNTRRRPVPPRPAGHASLVLAAGVARHLLLELVVALRPPSRDAEGRQWVGMYEPMSRMRSAGC